MSLYSNDPNSALAQLQNADTHFAQNRLSYEMPGYKEMYDLYKDTAGLGKWGQQLEDVSSPDYMERYAGMVDPMAFLQQAGFGFGTDGSGEGNYGPLGANQLTEFGEGAYELFDQFKPGMQYIAENQGVGEQELANRLGTSSSGYQQNIQNQEQQQLRQMGRMGIDPSSGAWQSGQGSRAMQGAQGLSGLQQQVRQDARGEDWKQRMEAAGIGLNLAGQGTDALGRATGAYNDALGTLGNVYGNYMQGVGNMAGITENARQYDKGYLADLTQGLTGARPAMDKTFYGMYQPQATWSNNATPSQEAAMQNAVFGLSGNPQNRIG